MCAVRSFISESMRFRCQPIVTNMDTSLVLTASSSSGDDKRKKKADLDRLIFQLMSSDGEDLGC